MASPAVLGAKEMSVMRAGVTALAGIVALAKFEFRIFVALRTRHILMSTLKRHVRIRRFIVIEFHLSERRIPHRL